MAESEEELKNLLMRVKEESERADLRLNIKKKTKIMHLAPWFLVIQLCPTLCGSSHHCSDFRAQEKKINHCFHCFPPSICHGAVGPDAMILVF